MKYKLVMLDMDGTLLPKGQFALDSRVVKAIRELQTAGVKVGLATGRNLPALPNNVLNGFKPDFMVCCNGARLLDARRNTIHTSCMTEQEMYALVDYCEDFDHPLAFVFQDGYYAYVEYEQMKAFYDRVGGFKGLVYDGEDQDHHLEGMPLAAFCSMPPDAIEGFQKKYGHLGLRFMAYSWDKYDIGRTGVDKAKGLEWLCGYAGVQPAEVVAVGDGVNDVGMIRAAGLGASMKNGAREAVEAATQLIPEGADAMAAFLRSLL